MKFYCLNRHMGNGGFLPDVLYGRDFLTKLKMRKGKNYQKVKGAKTFLYRWKIRMLNLCFNECSAHILRCVKISILIINVWTGYKVCYLLLVYSPVLNPINHWLYENLFTIGGGHMAPQPENPRNMSVGAETW